MNFADVGKTLTEASSVHHQKMIRSGKAVHDSGFHCSGAGTSQKNSPGILPGMAKLQKEPFILQHQMGEFRGSEIRYLSGTQ